MLFDVAFCHDKGVVFVMLLDVVFVMTRVYYNVVAVYAGVRGSYCMDLLCSAV
jgi:hypothetical protein